MSIKDLEVERARHAAEHGRLLAAIQAAIKALPDNPRIKRLGSSPNCFIMSSKDLDGNWSVEHHDFKKQYELVATEIGKAADPAARIRQILAEGRIKIKPAYGYTVTLHNDVVDHLSKACGIRWKSYASWPKDTFPSGGDVTTDLHDTREAAKGVCSLLVKEGFGGDRKVFPLKTWVVPEGMCHE